MRAAVAHRHRPYAGKSTETLVLRWGTALAVLAVAVSIVWGQALRRPALPDASSRGIAGRASGGPTPVLPAARTDRTIESLQARLRDQPNDATAYRQLGDAYLQKVRETADPTYYPKAEGIIAKALAIRPDDPGALASAGALALARHQFGAALDLGRRAQAQRPTDAATYGVIGDALVELGRYDDAIPAFQQMVDLRPDLASYARVSYMRELYGDLEGAIDAMQLAVSAGPPGTEGTAWARVQLGHLHFISGNLAAAEAEYQRALKGYPGHIPATAELGRLRAAQGRYTDAIGLLAPLAQALPLPDYVILLGEVYQASGDQATAAKQEELARTVARLQRANGVDVDLEMALFEADHATDPAALAAAVQDARAEYERRPSVHAADVLAWTLYRSGDPGAALPYVRESLRLGTKDPLVLFHAGAIAAAAGATEDGRRYLEAAIALNPHFSVRYDGEAQRLLDGLRAAAATG